MWMIVAGIVVAIPIVSWYGKYIMKGIGAIYFGCGMGMLVLMNKIFGGN